MPAWHTVSAARAAYGPGIDIGDVSASDTVVELLASGDERFLPGDIAVAKLLWCTAVAVGLLVVFET